MWGFFQLRETNRGQRPKAKRMFRLGTVGDDCRKYFSPILLILVREKPCKLGNYTCVHGGKSKVYTDSNYY